MTLGMMESSIALLMGLKRVQRVTTAKHTEEEHNQVKGWDDHFATSQFNGEAIKPWPIFDDGLLFTLGIVEEWQKRREGVSDSIGVTMLHESSKHLEAPTMILAPLVVKEKPERTVFNGKTYLTLPNTAGLLVDSLGS
jgi:hypothetical protein